MIVVSPMILDSSGSVLRRIDPVDVSLDLQLEPLSSAEIELKPGDTIPERSWVSVYTEHGLAGIFRSRPQRDRYGERSSRVSLVHGAVELNDYLTTKGGDQEQDPANTAIAYIMQFYLGTHWRLGTVSATSSVVYQLNGSGVLDAITEIMEQLPGYMLVFDQSVTPWTLNVLPRPEAVSAEGRLSRNISSVEISRDDSSLCTRVYYGENDLFVEDAAAIQKYGVIEYRINESGLTNAQLAAIAQAYLDNHKESKLSVSISAIDFYNATGEPLDRITLGSKYRLAIPDAETEENRVIEAIICSIHYDSVRSRNPQITLASDPDTIITFLKKQRRSGGSARQIAKEEAQKQYEHFVEETDAYRKEIYRVNGVVYDSNGNIVYQTDPVTGEYILDNAGNKIPVYNPESNGSISGQVIQSAQRMANIITQSGTVTEVFDQTKPYHIGDRVLYPDSNGTAYRFTKDHDANTPWKGTGQNGDVVVMGTLQTQIDQNTTGILTAAGEISDIDGRVQTIEGSTLWNDEDEIVNIVGSVSVDKANGKVVINNGYGLYTTDNGTQYGVWDKNSLTAGVIIQKINGGTGASGDQTNATKILGDKVEISSSSGTSVSIDDKIKVNSGATYISGTVMIGGTYGNNQQVGYVSINNDGVTAGEYAVRSGGTLKFIGTATGEYYSFTATDASKLKTLISTGLTNATVENNILTLTKSDGKTVNFSKATSVTGEWGSRATPESSPVPNGTLYVKATQTNRNTTTNQDETTTVGSMDIHLHNAGHWGSASTTGEDVNTYYYRVTASQGNSGSMSETGLSFNIDAGGRYTAGQDSITYSFTKAISLPPGINPTNFEPSALWRYHVTKDGTDVVDAYYKVPADIVPKVSASGWANGANTFTAGTSGESSIPVSLSIDAALNKTSGTASLRVLDGTTATGATKSLYLHVENAYVYILNQANAQPNDNTTTGNIVARITNTGYTNGWKAAHDAIVWPNPSSPSASMTITTPKSAPSPTPNTEGTTYTLSVDENYAYLKTGTGNSIVTVARVSNSYAVPDSNVSQGDGTVTHTWENNQYTIASSIPINGGSTLLFNATATDTFTPTDAINYGKSLVNLYKTYDWNDTGTHAGTYTIKTSGRTRANGVTEEDVDYLTPTEAMGSVTPGIDAAGWKWVESNNNWSLTNAVTASNPYSTKKNTLNVGLPTITVSSITNTGVTVVASDGTTEKVVATATHTKYADGQNSVSYTMKAASTTGTKTTLSDGVYGLYRTIDGTAEQTPIAYYEVLGGTGADPKVSKSAWQNGSTTFTAGTSGEASIPVSLSVVPITNWNNANVPANPTFRIYDGKTSTNDGTNTGLSGTFYLHVTNDAVYVKSNNSDPTIGTNVLAKQTNTAYLAGQQSVAPTGTPTISNSTANASTGKRTATLTVPYKGPDTTASSEALSGVDVTAIYNAGKTNGSETTTYNVTFDVPFSDGADFTTTKKVTVNCANIWNQGVDDATPATPKYYITTDGDPIIMWKSSGGDYSNFCGWLYPRTEVTVLGTSGYFYQVSYDGVTGYIAQARVEYSTSPTSSTNYPGKTGWSTFAENGYTYYAKTNTANVNLREGPSTSYPIILKMPADAQLYCMYDPADLPPDNQWNDVVYKKATHNLYLGSVDCSYINMEDATITVTVNWLRHSSDDYNGSVPIYMVPNGTETSVASSAINDTAYINTAVSSGVNINDFFNPTKTGFFGRYELAAVALTEMWHKVNFTVSYSDGSPSQTYTCEFKSYKKTSSAEFDVGQTVYVYGGNNGASVIVRTVPSVPSGTYGNLTPHTPVTIVSGPDNGYYQIRYAQTGYNTVTGYINADYLRSSVQGSSNYNYTGWVKSEPVEPTVTSRTISIVEVVHNRSVTTTTPISTRFTLKSPYTTSSSGGSLLVANSQARVVDVYNNHGSGYTRLSSLTAYFSQVTHSSSTYNYTLEHSVIFTVTTNYSDNTSTSTTYVGKISSNKT